MVLWAQNGSEEDIGEVISGLTARDWIAAAAILMAGIVVSRLVRALTARYVQEDDGERVVAHLVARVVASLIVVVAFVYSLASLGVELGPLLGALGIGGLALAFAAQSILENVFASVLLRMRRPFRRGDQILTNDHEGTIEEVNFRTVVLRSYDGERVMVPCAQVLSAPIVNYTARGQRRTSLIVGIPYDADLSRCRDVLLGAVADLDGVRAKPPPEAWVEEFAESSVNVTIRYWHASDIATVWRVRSEVAVAVKSALDREGIEIPFPQRTIGFLPGAARLEVGTESPDAKERPSPDPSSS